MKCPKCGNENIKEGQKFCMKCGQSLVELSPKTMEAKADSQTEDKGWFTEGVRSVANALTGGALNREIQREQNRAVRQQARQDNVSLQESQNAERAAIRVMQRAEQDAERRRNERNLDAIEGMDVIQGKAIWSIQPGQIARCVSEREFLEVEKLQGVIIQEGCRAIVYVDGEMIGMLSGGAYNFPKKTEEEKRAEKEKIEQTIAKEDEKEKRDKKLGFRELGVFGEIGRGLRAVHRFFFGRRNDEDVKKVKVRQQRVEQRLRALNKPRILRAYLVSERMLNLTFGGKENEDGGIDFVPMTIPTTILDVEMGVSLQMQISNISDFVKNYLADRTSATLGQFQKLLMPCVENTLKQLMRNLDYQTEGLPEPVIYNLKNRIQTAINERVYGIECVKVLDITDKNADFERFRSVERGLFNTAHELDFLQRTGEFRNRLVNETNHQNIQQASSEEELRYALANINKDKLLHEDEMEEFVLLLGSQKRLREAKSKEEEYETLQDLRKNRLVKDDDVAALEDALEHNKIDRDSVTDIMRLQAQQRVDEACLQSEYALSDARMQHEFTEADARMSHQQQTDMSMAQHAQQMQGVQLDSQRQMDQYQDERQQHNDDYGFSQQQRTDDYEFAKQQRTDDYDFAMQQRQSEVEWQQLQRVANLRQQQEEELYNRSRQDKFDEVEMAERYAKMSRDNMAMMQEGNLKAQNAQNAHEEQMHAMDAETERTRIQAETTMSHEQIVAAHMKDISGLDAAAQSEMAKMMGAAKEKETEMLRQQQDHERQMYEQMLQMNQQNQQAQMNASSVNQQQMMQMMQMAVNGMQQMGQNQTTQQQVMNAQQQQYQQQRYEDMQGLKNEYRDNMMHQQNRMDATQQQSLNYTSRVAQTDSQSAAQASFGGFRQQPKGPQQPGTVQPEFNQPVEEMTFCGECGCKVPSSSGVCPKCGAPLE